MRRRCYAQGMTNETLPIEKVLEASGFDLGGFDPWTVGRSLKMTDRQIRFALGRLIGMNASAALRAAGATQEGASLRTKASKANGSAKIQKFLELARDGKTGAKDKPLTEEEIEQRLAQAVRTSDDRAARAVTTAVKMIDDRNARRQRLEKESTPQDTLNEMATLGAEGASCAYLAARSYGLDWKLPANYDAASAAAYCRKLGTYFLTVADEIEKLRPELLKVDAELLVNGFLCRPSEMRRL